jgi:hypothetical protein
LLNRAGRNGRIGTEGRTMLKTERARASARFWTPEMRDASIRKSLAEIDVPEEIFQAIEGGKAKRTAEMKTRLLEIEQTL